MKIGMTAIRIFFLVLITLRLAVTQQAPLVIAWQAPNNTTTCGTTTCFSIFVTSELPYVSGIGYVIEWNQIDNCYNTKPCSTQSAMCNQATDYNWCPLDTILMAYINNTTTPFSNKKIVLIIYPESDSSGTTGNQRTPAYVFSSAWATSLSANPQDVVVCSAWPGDVNSTSSPVYLSGSGFGPNDFAIWNVNSCTNLSSPNIKCTTSSGPYTDFSGFPVVYEQPLMTAYQSFLSALAAHYNTVTGVGNGPTIAPYIAYVRVGMAAGGENYPYCATNGRISSATWSASQPIAAGSVVKGTDGNAYVATGGGTTGASSMPTCSPAGCVTSQDGSIRNWYNAGSAGSATGSAIWPGPNGQFGTGNESGDYSDNGYLTRWNITSIAPHDLRFGYVASMGSFLHNLGTSFSFTISSHAGPPTNLNVAYADSEAVIASSNGIGFGMESVSVGDPQTYAAGTSSGFPTSLQDWAQNFQAYPAPVHHLQMNISGSTYYGEQYPIGSISITSGSPTNEATINCQNGSVAVDCSPLFGQEIYVSGNSDNSLNGTWQVNCSGAGGTCSANTLQFATSLSPCSPCGTGGTVWAPDYWPIVMPFTIQRGASAVEIWECSLDYAFGVQTTTWVSSETSQGCATWGGTGPDSNYQRVLSNTLIGQPFATSILTGKGATVAGSHQF